MQPNLTPFGNPFLLNGDLSGDGFQTPPASVLFLVPFLLFQGGSGMDLSKVGEKILSSVRSARSLGLLPPASDRPEVSFDGGFVYNAGFLVLEFHNFRVRVSVSFDCLELQNLAGVM